MVEACARESNIGTGSVCVTGNSERTGEKWKRFSYTIPFLNITQSVFLEQTLVKGARLMT